MWALSLSSLIQEILFLLFAGLTALAAAVVGPTYTNLLVPELAPSALYPSLVGASGGASNYLAIAARFSEFTLGAIVDPAIALVALGVAAIYLARALSARWRDRLGGFLPRLLIAVIAANFTVPIAGLLVGLGGGLYPVVAGWDGGRWQQWINLAGYGEVQFSWDNGAVAFVFTIAEFFLVFGLVVAVALRDALLAVLLVLLPIFTLLWPFGLLAPLARRAWLLFVELVFLPCVLIVPLELAVGSPSVEMLLAYLICALSSPFLLSTAGSHLAAIGFPVGGATSAGGLHQGLQATSGGAASYLSPASTATNARSSPLGPALGSVARAAGSASAPSAAPLAAAHLVGQAGVHLVRHIGPTSGRPPGPGAWPPVRGGGPG